MERSSQTHQEQMRTIKDNILRKISDNYTWNFFFEMITTACFDTDDIKDLITYPRIRQKVFHQIVLWSNRL